MKRLDELEKKTVSWMVAKININNINELWNPEVT
jgi:hypothetical protein